MTDQYGVGNALRAFHHSMVMASRGTGRTTRMLEMVKDGDRIVLTQQNRRREIEHLLKAMGKDVTIIAVHPRNIDQIFNGPQPKGYTHFDHEWVDEYYRIRMDDIGNGLMLSLIHI